MQLQPQRTIIDNLIHSLVRHFGVDNHGTAISAAEKFIGRNAERFQLDRSINKPIEMCISYCLLRSIFRACSSLLCPVSLHMASVDSKTIYEKRNMLNVELVKYISPSVFYIITFKNRYEFN